MNIICNSMLIQISLEEFHRVIISIINYYIIIKPLISKYHTYICSKVLTYI